MTHPVMPRTATDVRWQRVALAIAVLSPCLAVAPANSQTPEASGSPESVEPLQLAEQDYAARQQATLEMWRRRDLSRDEVQAASRHSDPEVASRAQWILRQWRRGALPDTPPDVSRLLQRTDDPSAIEELLDAAQFTAAVVAVEESAGTADRDAVRSRAVASMQRRFPVYVVQANRSGQLPDLLKLVDLVANNKEMAVTRVELMRKLGLEIDEASLLPEAAETWTEAERVQAKVLVHACLGNLDAAIETASAAGDESLARMSLMLGQRWSQLAEENAAAARAAPTGSLEQTRYWCYALVGADRAGLEELRREAIAGLASDDAAASKEATELRWKCLVSHREVDAALKILGASEPASAALLAVAASRPEEAFEWLGVSVEEVELQLRTLVAGALEQQASSNAEGPTPELTRVLALTRCLLSIGRDELAWIAAEGLARSEVAVGNATVRDILLLTLSMPPYPAEWVVRLAVFPEEDALGLNRQGSVVRALDEADDLTLKILIDAFGRMHPEVSFEQRFRAVCEFIAGEVPAIWNGSSEYRRLYDQLTVGKRQIQRVGGQVFVASSPQLNLHLVKLFARHGEAGLADDALQQMIGFGDVESAFQLAENQRVGGRQATADALYQSVWNAIATQRLSRQSVVSGAGSQWALKSLIGQWLLAKRSSDPETEARLLDEIHLALCSPSTELRHEAAQYLVDIGEDALAKEIYETLVPMTAYGTREATQFYDVANRFASLIREGDAGRAAEWFDLAVVGTIESAYSEVAYVMLPLYVSRWKLEAAVERGDADAVHQQLRGIAQLNPIDIDSAERVFPKMREAKMGEVADEALASVLDRGTEYLKQFPMDATTHNNLAWVAAINDTALEQAKQWSLRAVYLEPDSAVFRDTLAEVLFRLGEVDQALLVERACLLDEPREWHLHEQVERFRASSAKPGNSAQPGSAVKAD